MTIPRTRVRYDRRSTDRSTLVGLYARARQKLITVRTCIGALPVGVPSMQGPLLKLALALEQTKGSFWVVHLWPPSAPTAATLSWRSVRSLTLKLDRLNTPLSRLLRRRLRSTMKGLSPHRVTIGSTLSCLCLLASVFMTRKQIPQEGRAVQQLVTFPTTWLKLR